MNSLKPENAEGIFQAVALPGALNPHLRTFGIILKTQRHQLQRLSAVPWPLAQLFLSRKTRPMPKGSLKQDVPSFTPVPTGDKVSLYVHWPNSYLPDYEY